MQEISLFLDTCSEFLHLILLVNNQPIGIVRSQVNFTHSEKTPLLIDQLLAKHNLTWMQIKKLYLIIGPGYYSGLRVGVAIAKTWFLVNPQLKIYVLSSLCFLAGTKGQKISCVWVTKKNLFYQLFDSGQAKHAPIQISNEELITLLQNKPRFSRIDYASIVNWNHNFQTLKLTFKLVRHPDELKPNYLRAWI